MTFTSIFIAIIIQVIIKKDVNKFLINLKKQFLRFIKVIKS